MAYVDVNVPVISKITLPSGNTYYIADREIRDVVDTLSQAVAGGVKYIIAWDGSAALVVANIPAGVVVTYNGTNYTGTLTADSAQPGAFYLVKSATQVGGALDKYDEYVPVGEAGSKTWEKIGASLALGETSSTAYRGDRGKTAYDHSQLTSGNPHNVSKSDVGLGNVDNVQQYSASNPPPYPVTSVNGSTGAVTFTIPTKTSDLTNDSGFITGMTILSYGNSTWNDFINAYDANKVVYCRASSNSNPASGSQTRLAFMAYVNNVTTPNNVEFQYYRSVSSHTEAQQGDQVYVYKLDRNSGWSVTTREASVKVAYNNGITGTYSNGVMTLKHANTAITAQSTQAVYPIAIDAYGHITGYGSAVTIPEIPSVTVSDNGKILTVVNGAWAAANLPTYQGGVN